MALPLAYLGGVPIGKYIAPIITSPITRLTSDFRLRSVTSNALPLIGARLAPRLESLRIG